MSEFFNKSFVVLIIGNSKSFHLGAQGTFKVKHYLVKAKPSLYPCVFRRAGSPQGALLARAAALNISIYLPIYLSIDLSIYLSIYMYVVYVYMYLPSMQEPASKNLSAPYRDLYISIYPSIYLSICISICISIDIYLPAVDARSCVEENIRSRPIEAEAEEISEDLSLHMYIV